MTDLVERLRSYYPTMKDGRDAADRIEALEATLRKAQDSLEWHSDETSRAIVAEIEKVLK